MGLLGNMFVLSTGVHRPIGDLPANSVGARARYSSFCNTRSRDMFSTVLASLSFPVGLTPGSAFIPPQIGGEMCLRGVGDGNLTAALIPTRTMSLNLTGAGDLDASAVLLVAMVVALTGSGDLDATIAGIGTISAGLSGSGDLDATLDLVAIMLVALTGSGALTASIQGSLSMSASLTGSGDLDATIGALATLAAAFGGSGSLVAAIERRLNMAAAMTGSGSVAANLAARGNMTLALAGVGDLDAVVAAYGNMSIDIVVTGTGLTTANVGPAVWNAIATANDNPGTMGELLNDATAEALLTALVEGGVDVRAVLRRLLATHSGDATVPRAPGPSDPPVNFAFRDQADTINRITGTIDSNGNRIITSTNDT